MYSWKKLILWIFTLSVFLFFFIRGQPWFSQFNAHALLEKYSQEEIDHFANFAFQGGELRKWKRNIVYKNIRGDYQEASIISSIKNCVDQLNTLLKEVRIKEEIENKYNVRINFLDSMDSNYGNASLKYSTFKIPYPAINGSNIKLLVKDRKSEEINSTIFHEFTHLLGFNHNTNTIDYQSIFNPSPLKEFENKQDEDKSLPAFHEYSGLDKAAIRIMYDAGVAIDPGMTKEKFYRKIEEARRNMEK